MKRIIAVFLLMLVTAGMAGCGTAEPKQSEAPLVTPDASISQDALKDDGLLKCVSEAFQEIDIDTSASSFVVIRDDETSGVRNVRMQTVYDNVNMTFSCLSVDSKWSAVSISDSDSKQYYWIANSSQQYGDVYDWKTGELISSKKADIPDTIPTTTTGPDDTSFSSVMTYDENNSCTMSTTIKNDTTSITGICQFSGIELEAEALRSLAFTAYCLTNATTFCGGNLTMLYYSGDDDGFASYVDGEIVLSDFPNGWNDYAAEITQEQIKSEWQNIVDNIKPE